VLPRYNSVYMLVVPGDTFGVIDIVYNDLVQKYDEEENESEDNHINNGQRTFLRKFTAQCIEKVEYLTLS